MESTSRPSGCLSTPSCVRGPAQRPDRTTAQAPSTTKARSRGPGFSLWPARADADTAADGPDNWTGRPAVSRSPAWSAEDQAGAAQDQAAPRAPLAGSGPPAGTTTAQQDHDARAATTVPSGIGQARVAASRLAAAGRPVSRRALRSEGIRGSNQVLNALARTINAELAGTAVVPARPGNAVV